MSRRWMFSESQLFLFVRPLVSPLTCPQEKDLENFLEIVFINHHFLGLNQLPFHFCGVLASQATRIMVVKKEPGDIFNANPRKYLLATPGNI